MVADAAQHAAEDAQRRERVEARNAADSLIYQAERFLVSVEDGLPEELRQGLEARVRRVREVIEGADVAQIRAATQDLREALLDLNPGRAPGGPAAGGAAGADGAGGADGAAGAPPEATEDPTQAPTGAEQ